MSDPTMTSPLAHFSKANLQFGNSLLPDYGKPLAGLRRRSKQDRRAAYPLFVQRAVAQFATINETVCILNGIAE